VAAGLDAGPITVRARRIGYRAGEVAGIVERGRNTMPLVLGEVTVPTLAAVRVVGDREVLSRNQEFETRRMLHQATASITAADIDKRNPSDTWQMLTNVPSMRVIPFGPGVYAMSARGVRSVVKPGDLELKTSACWYRVMIDGLALPDSMPDLGRLPRPSEVYGIEVFAGPATIPPQYNSPLGGAGGAGNNYCGLIAIWRK
jgi:hypothetical protein